MPQAVLTANPERPVPLTQVWLYSCLVILAQAASLGGTLLLTTQPWFVRHSGYPGYEQMGYEYKHDHFNCVILLYGDSTALAGLDSELIQQKTGLKTCNISETRPVEDAVGVDFPLQRYLARNPRPEFLVTAWTPNDLNLERKAAFNLNADGLGYALQYDRGPWLWKMVLSKPRPTVYFLLWSQTAILRDTLSRLSPAYAAEHRASLEARDAHGGVWRYPTPPQTSCVTKSPYVLSTHAENAASIASFREKYRAAGIHVIVDVSPVASCDEDLRRYATQIAGLTDNQLNILPVTSFNAENIHLTRSASLVFSEQVAEQIVAVGVRSRIR